MAPNVGTHDIDTLLAVKFQSAAEFGLDTIQEILQSDIDAHNEIVDEMLDDLTSVTTDRQRIYGTSAGGEMVKVDEYARSATQKDIPGSPAAFPLELFQFPVGWTDKYFQLATPADMAIKVQSAEKAHLKAIRAEIARAFFRPTNRTVRDWLVDKVPLDIKAFVNADGADIPEAEDGSTFDGATHTHYDAINGLTNAAALALIRDVLEHGHDGRIILAIHYNDETTVRGLADFKPAPDYRVQPATTADVTRLTTNPARLFNRYIGILGAAEVWIKPWAKQNYLACYATETDEKPLVFRERPQAGLQGLRIAATLDTYPLHAQFMEAEFGVAVWTRTNGAVLYFGGASYTEPA